MRIRRPALKNFSGEDAIWHQRCVIGWKVLAPISRDRNWDRSSDHNDASYSSDLVFEMLFLFWSGPFLSSYLSPIAGWSIICLPEFCPHFSIKSTLPLAWGKAVCVVSSQACLDHSFPKFHGVRYKLLEDNRINPVQSPSCLLHYGYAGNAPPRLSKWDRVGTYEFPNPYHKSFNAHF